MLTRSGIDHERREAPGLKKGVQCNERPGDGKRSLRTSDASEFCRQARRKQAIQRGVQEFETTWHTKGATNSSVQAQVPSDEPCLSIIDYMNWAVDRAFTRGEMRYYRTVEDKVSLLVDSPRKVSMVWWRTWFPAATTSRHRSRGWPEWRERPASACCRMTTKVRRCERRFAIRA